MENNQISLVQKQVVSEYSKAGVIKKYPSLELVRIEKKFFNIDAKEPKLLEYGFGTGCNTECLLDEGYEVYGIDVSPFSLEKTRHRIDAKGHEVSERLHLSLLDENANTIDYEDNYFDYVVAMSVLSLLGSEQRIRLLLKEFKRVLRKGGRIILDINDQESEFSAGKKEIEKNVFIAGPYGDNLACYCLKSEEDFQNLVKDYFIIKDSGYSCHKLFGRRINEWIICGQNY